MYAALWRLLPGPMWLRLLLLLIALVVIITVLMVWVFPWIDSFITTQEGTVGG